MLVSGEIYSRNKQIIVYTYNDKLLSNKNKTLMMKKLLE